MGCLSGQSCVKPRRKPLDKRHTKCILANWHYYHREAAKTSLRVWPLMAWLVPSLRKLVGRWTSFVRSKTYERNNVAIRIQTFMRRSTATRRAHRLRIGRYVSVYQLHDDEIRTHITKARTSLQVVRCIFEKHYHRDCLSSHSPLLLFSRRSP